MDLYNVDKESRETLPLEMWNAILQFLDTRGLALAQKVCKDFYYLAVREEHWKREAYALFTSDITPYYNEKYNGTSSWCNLIKDLSQHDLSGGWDIYIKLDGNSDVFTIYGQWDIKNNPSNFTDKILNGFGNAPWGHFSTFGCNIGPYYTMLHTYNEGAYFSSYFGTIDEDTKTHAKIIYGPYKTNWEDLTGKFVAINTSIKLDRKAIIEILQERLNRTIKARTSRENYESILAKFAGRVFEASFTIDKSALDNSAQNSNFRISFKLNYSNNQCGLNGYILTTHGGMVPMSVVKSTLVLATISRNMIQISFVLWRKQHSIETITSIFKFEIDEKQVEISNPIQNNEQIRQNQKQILHNVRLSAGRYAWKADGILCNYGQVIGHSIDEKSVNQSK